MLAGLVIAAWSLLLVAWLTLHWGILPHIDEWRPRIAARASQALGVPVQIQHIAVRSGGWWPALELRGVVLHDTQGRPALTLPHVVAVPSLRSLLALELRLEQLLVDGAQLDVRRDRTGRLFVAGMDMSGPSRGDGGAANWFFKQPEFVIRGGSLTWTDEQRDAPALTLSDVQLVVRNGLRRHALRLDATPPADWGERFTVQGRFTHSLLREAGDWQRWSGTLHVELPRADVRQLRRHVRLPFELSEGDGALRAWLDVRDGRPHGATVDLALREVTLRLAPHVEPLALEQIEGRLAAQHTDQGWQLSARQFGFVTGDGIRWPRGDLQLSWRQREGQPTTGGEFSAQRLDLALMAQIASRVPMGEALARLLAEVDPKGVMTDFTAGWQGALDAPSRYRAQGVVSGLSLAAKASEQAHTVGRPGLHNATIAFTAHERGGDARLQIADGALEFPGVFEAPKVELQTLAAALQWHIEPAKGAATPPRVSVTVKDARFANADAQGRFDASWSTGDAQRRYPGQLELVGQLARGDAARVARYLPMGLPQRTRDYVTHAVRAGRISAATFRVKGDLRDFPFHRLRQPEDGEFHIAGQVEDVELAYVPGAPASDAAPAVPSPWPALTRVRGELVFDRASMEIRNAHAQVYGVELSRVAGGIRQFGDRATLQIEGQARGPLADMLRYVNSSPVGTLIGGALARTSATAAADLRLALAIPLGGDHKPSVKGSVTLAGNDLRITPDTPLLSATHARVDFTHEGFSVAGARARVLGGEVQFDGGQQADGSARFTGQGTVTAEGVRQAPELGPLARVAGSLRGQTTYRMALGVVRGHTELHVSSNLLGLASDLPAPLRKTADQPLPLRYAVTLVPESLAAGQAPRDTLQLELGNLVSAHYHRDLSGPSARVLRGGIGVLEAPSVPASGVTARIQLPQLDVSAWEAVARQLTDETANGPPIGSTTAHAGTDYAPQTIALRANQLVSGSRRLDKVVAGITRDHGAWRANVDAEQLGGYIEYRPPGSSGAGRVYARLARLSLPKSEAEGVETLIDQTPASVPALDVVVDNFELRGKRLGHVEIEAVNRVQESAEAAREWKLNRLAITLPEARFIAHGVWAPWATAGGGRRAELNFKLELADSGALLERLGTRHVVRGGKGQLSGEVSWLGSPFALDYPSLSGQVNVAIDAGQFLKAEPGAARLLSVLSLQSLPRRLALDFRDLFQEGFAFDNVTGDVSIRQGVAYTNNLRMRGVQAAVLMEGSADLRHETQEMRVVVVPEINAGTASLAYAAINPAVGLGTFLAQMFLRKPLTQAGTREFQVTGSWDDPKVERVQRKLADSAGERATPSSPADTVRR
jgi:uncharacterized protein (TIGR02099 family)